MSAIRLRARPTPRNAPTSRIGACSERIDERRDGG
ncbi:hypothetical protein X736_30295 [Mesorhizobium sp. L2C089B000]|nr:hypothetical protein X736_30295 [Mesorhizobium sp. L2C089B000]